jgi:hypothetical protein
MMAAVVSQGAIYANSELGGVIEAMKYCCNGVRSFVAN